MLVIDLIMLLQIMLKISSGMSSGESMSEKYMTSFIFKMFVVSTLSSIFLIFSRLTCGLVIRVINALLFISFIAAVYLFFKLYLSIISR